MHRADVSVFPNRAVNAENDQRTFRPRSIPDLAADNPAVVIRNLDRNQRRGSHKQSASPASGPARLPRKPVASVMPEPFAGRVLRRTAFLRQDKIRFQVADHTRPMAAALQASG